LNVSIFMTLMLRCTRICLIPLLSVAWLSGAAAASLGRINVHSALGESFRADIDVQNVAPDEAGSLQVKLASPDTYRRNGVDFNPSLLGIRATLSNDGRNPMIVLRSASGVNEPVLDVLVELSSDKGSVVKKYTILLDPAASKSPEPEAAIATSQARPPSTQLGTQSPAASSYLRLKPSLSLKTDSAAVFASPSKPSSRLSKRLEKRLKKQLALEAKREAKRKAKREAKLTNKRDTLSVAAPNNSKDVLKDDSPQALAKRLVKSGITDAAQIEALINALSIAKSAALAKEAPTTPLTSTATSTANSASNNAQKMVSVLDLPVFAQVPAALPATSAPALLNSPAVAANVPLPVPAVVAPTASSESVLDSAWAWLGLCLAGLLAALAWLSYNKRKQALAFNDSEEHYPLTQFDTLHAPDLNKDTPKTEFYETAFFNEIDTQKSQVNLSPATSIAFVDEPAFESSGNHAASMLNELLEDNPSDNTVRIMLMSMLSDQQDLDGLNVHLAQLKIHTQAQGPQWEEGLALQTALIQQKSEALNSALPQPIMESDTEQPLEFDNSPMFSLDLSNPTVFSPAAGVVSKTLPVKTAAKQKSNVVEFGGIEAFNTINTVSGASRSPKPPQQEITLSLVEPEIKPANKVKKKPT
jgi:hypothetical protein